MAGAFHYNAAPFNLWAEIGSQQEKKGRARLFLLAGGKGGGRRDSDEMKSVLLSSLKTVVGSGLVISGSQLGRQLLSSEESYEPTYRRQRWL